MEREREENFVLTKKFCFFRAQGVRFWQPRCHRCTGAPPRAGTLDALPGCSWQTSGPHRGILLPERHPMLTRCGDHFVLGRCDGGVVEFGSVVVGSRPWWLAPDSCCRYMSYPWSRGDVGSAGFSWSKLFSQRSIEANISILAPVEGANARSATMSKRDWQKTYRALALDSPATDTMRWEALKCPLSEPRPGFCHTVRRASMRVTPPPPK